MTECKAGHKRRQVTDSLRECARCGKVQARHRWRKSLSNEQNVARGWNAWKRPGSGS